MTALLILAPALLTALTLLALTLLARRFPGERVLTRLASRATRTPRGRNSRGAPALQVRASAWLLPRGGSLLASPLAVRPPPAAVRAG